MPSKSSPQPLAFNFWGTHTQVCTQTEHDARHLSYYFADHLASPESSKVFDISLMLCTNDGSPFVGALGNPSVENRIYIHSPTRSNWALYEAFTARAKRPSPLPPFPLPPMRGSFKTQHASVVKSNTSAEGMKLTGSSGSGKSTLLLALLKSGYQFVADDVAIIDSNNHIRPYFRPVGIRHNTLSLFPELTDCCAGSLSFATATGTTYAVQPSRLPYALATTNVQHAITVQLSPAPDFSIMRITNDFLTIGWEPRRHLNSAVTAIRDAGFPQVG